MASHHQRDPLEDLIEDGRVRTRPFAHNGFPYVLTVDLDRLATTLSTRLLSVYLYDFELGNWYSETTEAITTDVYALVDFAVGQVYNRLRSIPVLKCHHPSLLTTRMSPRCPIPNDQEFPAWLASTLSHMGLCRITNGPHDQIILYVSSAATMHHYGRASQIVYNAENVAEDLDPLITAFKSRNVAMVAIDSKNVEFSYFPMVVPEISSHGVWTLYGNIHHFHYENEDVARTTLCTNNEGLTPFESTGMSIAHVSDAATVTALAAAAALEGIPEGQDADSAGRPIRGVFRVNYFGIQRDLAKGPGIYVIGRGIEPYYSSILAGQIYDHEVSQLLRHRLLLRNII